MSSCLQGHYCKACSTAKLASWKGWPNKDILPLLPRIISGICEECTQETVGIVNSSIKWIPYLGEDSDCPPPFYYLLRILNQKSRDGLPYCFEKECPTCRSRSIVSLMIYPNGKKEASYNCTNCGLINDLALFDKDVLELIDG